MTATRLDERNGRLLGALALLYLAASLLHFAHNAEYLGDYPNLPLWLTRAQIYLAWSGLAATGVAGYVLYRIGWQRSGLGLLGVYAAFGFDGLLHYTRAPFAAHSATMNFTIWFEVVVAALLLLAVLAQLARRLRHQAPVIAVLLTFTTPLIAQEAKRVTILYDAFGAPSALIKDWGFAAFVEYGGKRVLFDTGNNAKIFEHNARQIGVDLTRLDAVVISHRHGDHTSGLAHLLEVNSTVKIHAPQEGAFFKSTPPTGFLERHPGLPLDLRYYEGKQPERWISGSPWEKGNFEIVTETTEIIPGFFVLTTRSQKPGTLEMNEVSLAIRTPEGLAVVVGCSHPGVERILEEAAKIDRRIYTVMGGFHLVLTPRQEVERTAEALFSALKTERVAPGHCTSELGFAVFLDRFKDRFDRAGLGTVISLP